MTKQEIIKQEIMGEILIPNLGVNYAFTPGQSPMEVDGTYNHVVIVDIDKLAKLLAKYLDIKIEEGNPQPW